MKSDVNLKRRVSEPSAEPSSVRLHRPDSQGVEIGLTAAIVAVVNDEPVVLVVREGEDSIATEGLPFGPFSPREHRTLEKGLRSWVSEQATVELGYVEQLYTFADRGRHADPGESGAHLVSIGYLALTDGSSARELQRGIWRSWYHYFPWEDWRKGRPEILETEIVPRLKEWAQRPVSALSTARPVKREDRVRMCFGTDGTGWDEERVLERYELMYEAGLVEETRRDRPEVARAWGPHPRFGAPMRYDHRRVLATAIGRVRGKIKYRPVIFELMPDDFTLFELQKTVEAILGPHLHKQNFRRLVESAGLVEPTGEVKTRTGGRPAKLFRFRREVLLERPAPGVRVKAGRAL
jgi:hypothetical protein